MLFKAYSKPSANYIATEKRANVMQLNLDYVVHQINACKKRPSHHSLYRDRIDAQRASFNVRRRHFLRSHKDVVVWNISLPLTEGDMFMFLHKPKNSSLLRKHFEIFCILLSNPLH